MTQLFSAAVKLLSPSVFSSNTELGHRQNGTNSSSLQAPSLPFIPPKSSSHEGSSNWKVERDSAADNLPATPPIFDNTKPFMIIHIGPSKTGTSTIQRESESFRNNHTLELDNYIYLGKFAHHSIRMPSRASTLIDHNDCFQEAAAAWKKNLTTRFTDTPCWADKLSHIYEKYYKMNFSIVFSDEA